jgi:hypothetical protein
LPIGAAAAIPANRWITHRGGLEVQLDRFGPAIPYLGNMAASFNKFFFPD